MLDEVVAFFAQDCTPSWYSSIPIGRQWTLYFKGYHGLLICFITELLLLAVAAFVSLKNKLWWSLCECHGLVVMGGNSCSRGCGFESGYKIELFFNNLLLKLYCLLKKNGPYKNYVGLNLSCTYKILPWPTWMGLSRPLFFLFSFFSQCYSTNIKCINWNSIEVVLKILTRGRRWKTAPKMETHNRFRAKRRCLKIQKLCASRCGWVGTQVTSKPGSAVRIWLHTTIIYLLSTKIKKICREWPILKHLNRKWSLGRPMRPKLDLP